MKTFRIIIVALLGFTASTGYSQNYKVAIEPFPKMVKADPRLILKTGYLIVPENRSKPNGRKIKVPFFFVRRPDQDAKRNVSLYMTGGPGYSTTAGIDSIAYESGFLRYGGFIAFDQRGTKRAQPCLDGDEVYEAIRRSYREGKDHETMVLQAVSRYRERLVKQGIDLSAYNLSETVEDINDLRLALQLDSLNLVGISYSGGVMLSVVRKHPEAVKTLILNSPLPTSAKYEEHGLLNINEALEQVFTNCAADSAGVNYKDLRSRFHAYFTDLGNKKFAIKYLEKGKKDSIAITYGKQELLDAVVDRLNTAQVREVPGVIVQLMSGNHKPFVREVLDGYFRGDASISLGLRYAVYCSEQIAYSDPKLIKQQDKLLPWLAGYRFNNVNHAISNRWKVKPVAEEMKQPIYSKVPALISAGDADPWCRLFYNRDIKRYMPNAQLLIIHDRGHGSGFSADGVNYMDAFMKDPPKKLVAGSRNVVVE